MPDTGQGVKYNYQVDHVLYQEVLQVVTGALLSNSM